jgi:hypothetical protein
MKIRYRRSGSTRSIRTIPLGGVRLPESGAFGGLLSVGPEERYLLVTGLVRSESDLYLVENLR